MKLPCDGYGDGNGSLGAPSGSQSGRSVEGYACSFCVSVVCLHLEQEICRIIASGVRASHVYIHSGNCTYLEKNVGQVFKLTPSLGDRFLKPTLYLF